MRIAFFTKRVERLISDNSPVILTGIGVVGSLTAAYLTGRASFKAYGMIEEEFDRRIQMNVEGFTNVDKAKLVWKLYIPPVATSAVTVASIVCANRISTHRAAAMAAAYTLQTKAFSDYREKVAEKFNVNKEKQVRDEIAQDKVTNSPPDNATVIVTGNGDVTCLDVPNMRYFQSNVETIRKVENDINAQINHSGEATLSDFYIALGLPTTPWSEEIGWDMENMLTIDFSTAMGDHGQPVITINYKPGSVRGYKSIG